MKNWNRKAVSLKNHHIEWLDRTMISLSKFVQRKIDEELEKEKMNGDNKGI